MKVLILQNIVSSNNVYTINSLIEKYGLKKHEVVVYFCAQTESNRRWTLHEKPVFAINVLPQFSLKIENKDLFTYFVNLNIFSVLSKEDPDWIIVGGWDQFSYQAATIWGALQKKRVTIWSGSTIYEKSWRRVVAWPLVRFLIHIASDYIAYGSRARDYLLQMGATSDKISIHLNDVNRAYFAKEAKKFRPKRTSLKKSFDILAKKNFLFVGQFIERKGILDLVSAYERIHKKNPDWGLVLIGYGSLEQMIRQTIREKKLSNVRMLGAIEQYDLPAYYSVCDCLVLPSREEVWGLVANEALACGLRVILSDRCGCVGDLGSQKSVHVFTTGDVSKLAASMQTVIAAKA